MSRFLFAGLTLSLMIASLLACKQASMKISPAMLVSGKSLRFFINQEITVQGQAADSKSGAMLLGPDFSLYMEGMESWPDGMFGMNRPLKNVEATGFLIEAYDLPVFAEEKGAPVRSGIPVSNPADLQKASHRFLLKKARWKIIPELSGE